MTDRCHYDSLGVSPRQNLRASGSLGGTSTDYRQDIPAAKNIIEYTIFLYNCTTRELVNYIYFMGPDAYWIKLYIYNYRYTNVNLVPAI